jgi:hypothetical protein
MRVTYKLALSDKDAAHMTHAGRPAPPPGALPTPATSDDTLLFPMPSLLLLLFPVLPLLQRPGAPPPGAPPTTTTRRPTPPAPPPPDAPLACIEN